MAAGAVLMYFLDRRQGHRRRSQAVQRTGGLLRRGARRGKRAARHAASDAAGSLRRAAHPRVTQKPPSDDVTLARKVETEIFRPADAPKSTVNVSAVGGVVELRGHVDRSEQIKQLERMARRVRGVRDVRNLLHLSGTPAPTTPG
jgi:osmotically-inducible protein OsmY